MTKIIAMYLPQFHSVPENDEWWGKGFTEWTAVKKAEQIVSGQYQPRIPLDGNYYDLLDKKTMKWQADLMDKYGIDGLCFYHYYFKDGRKILERPAENLLEWTDINMPFCFSWANETWARSWSKLTNVNFWSSKFENNNNDNGVLLEQAYGGEQQWKNHFEYLLPFFRDERYIKIDDKPIFIFYRPQSIPCLVRMVEYWRELAIKAGLKGIYLIGTNIKNTGVLDAVMIQEPQNTLATFEKKCCIDINDVWNQSIISEGIKGEKTFYCGFPGYDDTPRRGNGGIYLKGSTPEVFQKNMEKLLAKSEYYENEFTFVNAWNEWGEGMYLEPDEKFGYGYLEAVKNAKKTYQNIGYRHIIEEKNEGQSKIIDRYKSYWTLFDRWLYKLECGCTLNNYFVKKGIKNIAIYGIGMVGKHFINQIEDYVNIIYAIDRRNDNVNMQFPIFTDVNCELKVDAIVVTVSYDYPEIYKKLREKADCHIILIDEVIEEC